MDTIKKTSAVLMALLLAAVTLGLAVAPAAEASDALKASPSVTHAPGDSGWTCPAGSIEDNKGQCRKPVADASVCPKGAIGVSGACYIFVDKVMTRTGEECPAGSFEDNEGKCRKPVADTIVCPKGSLGVPGACYIFVDKVLSRTGTVWTATFAS